MFLGHVRRSTGWMLGLAVVGLAACESTSAPPLPEPPAPPAAQIKVELVEPSEDGVVNTIIAGPIFRATNVDGTPAAGTTVTFAVLNGGSLENTTVAADGDGLASPGGWMLGPRATTQYLTAVAVGPAALTSVHALAEEPEEPEEE